MEIFRSVAAEYGWPDYRPKEKIAKVDPRIYDSYVGEYEIAPGFILTVTREGDQLMMSQATGQPKSKLFPESETVFFVKDANAQFTFVRKDGGAVTQVNIQRGSRLFEARRVK